MQWSTKLENWYQGYDIPSHKSNKSFFFETSPILKCLDNIYEEEFIESDELNMLVEDSMNFNEYLANPNNEYCTSFYNPNRTTKLIIPTKVKGTNYKSIKEFMDTSPLIQQQYLWRQVAIEAYNMLKDYNKIWISTHGLGVPYLHIRIDITPKYYKTRKFIST